MQRVEIRWYTFAAPDKRRPVLILSRPEVVDILNALIVVPVTRTIRGLATEVVLARDVRKGQGKSTRSDALLDTTEVARLDRMRDACSGWPRLGGRGTLLA